MVTIRGEEIKKIVEEYIEKIEELPEVHLDLLRRAAYSHQLSGYMGELHEKYSKLIDDS